MKKGGTLRLVTTHKRVEHLDDDEPGSLIVTLRLGWTWDSKLDNRVRGFDSASEALAAVRQEALPFAGPYDP